MDEINTEHNMKSICRPAVVQWTECLTRKGQTRVRNWKGANILLSHYLSINNNCLIGSNCPVTPGVLCQTNEYAPQLYGSSISQSLTAGDVSYVCIADIAECLYNLVLTNILKFSGGNYLVDAGWH